MFKERSDAAPDLTFIRKFYSANGSLTGSAAKSYPGDASSESISYVDIPNYYAKRKSGVLMPYSPVTHNKWSTSGWGPTTVCTKTVISDGSYVVGPVSTNHVPRSGYMPDLGIAEGNYLVAEAMANAKADAWDVLTFLAEAKESLLTVTRAGARLAQYMESTAEIARKRSRRSKSRRNSFKSISRDSGEALDIAGNVWLEGRYGWRPLVYDFHSAIEAYNRLQNTFRRSRGYASLTESGSSSDVILGTHTSSGGVLPNVAYTTNWTCDWVGCGIIDMIPNHQSFQFDVLTTAWELIPYSFMVDWVANVGDLIQAHSPSLAVKGQVSGLSFKLQATTNFSFDSWYLGSNVTANSASIAMSTHEFSYQRVPMSPSLLPTFRENFDIWKALDGLAIMRGFRHRTLRKLFN